MTSLRGALVALALLVAVTHAAPGQGTSATITGTVRDETGRELEHALVALDPATSNVRTRADVHGRFRFTQVAAGEHVLRVTWIGFTPDERPIRVLDRDIDVTVVLRRSVTALDTVAVRATRSGVYGMIIDGIDYKPLPGARVEVLGSAPARDTTGADGLYAMGNVRRGAYMLRASRDGYATRVMTVEVPKSGGTRLDVVLDSAAHSGDLRMEMLWADLNARIRASGINSALVTRDELAPRGGVDLEAAIRFAPSFAKKTFYVPTTACIFVDGMPAPGRTLSDFSANDIEAVEVYGRRGENTGTLMQRWPPKVPCGRPWVNPPPRQANLVSIVSIWLKK